MTDRRTLANAIRFLSIDAVQAANSGHPGAPMGMADVAEVLWRQVLRHNPRDPEWPNRDRFVLSNGHGSMLIYSLLHLTGYDVTTDDSKLFRQLKLPDAGPSRIWIHRRGRDNDRPVGSGPCERCGDGAR